MLALAPHRKIDLPLPPTDLRKSFDGLTGLVRWVSRLILGTAAGSCSWLAGLASKAGGWGKRDPVHSNAPEGLFWYHLGRLSLVLYRAPKDAR